MVEYGQAEQAYTTALEKKEQSDVDVLTTSNTLQKKQTANEKKRCAVQTAQEASDGASLTYENLTNAAQNLEEATALFSRASTQAQTALEQKNQADQVVSEQENQVKVVQGDYIEAQASVAAFESLKAHDFITDGVPENPGVPDDVFSALSSVFAAAIQAHEGAQGAESELL